MKYQVIILPLAKQDIRAAAQWYQKQQIGLGKKFTRQIRTEIDFIQRNPELIAIRYQDVKTAVVRIFPFMIHFKVDSTKNQILIIAVFIRIEIEKNGVKEIGAFFTTKAFLRNKLPNSKSQNSKLIFRAGRLDFFNKKVWNFVI